MRNFDRRAVYATDFNGPALGIHVLGELSKKPRANCHIHRVISRNRHHTAQRIKAVFVEQFRSRGLDSIRRSGFSAARLGYSRWSWHIYFFLNRIYFGPHNTASLPASGIKDDLIITCVFSELPRFMAPTGVYPLRSKNGTAVSTTRAKLACR